jgi:SAM-dependent methyltransferase
MDDTTPAADTPALQRVDLGDLRRLEPIDGAYGCGRGRPIDRHYIEGFLQRRRGDVQGRVLEVGDDHYTRRFGGDRVVHGDVLHGAAGNPRATLVGDLATGKGLPEACYDCFICTQTLQYVYDLPAAAATIARLLAPGGVLLLTVPGISQISPVDRGLWGEHWRFTPESVERLLRGAFGTVEVAGHGNVLAAIGFLHGLSCEDLRVEELDHHDDRYPMLVTARAVKTDGASLRREPP